jgi:dTDP-4-amino-4,6-dideoxygalactose transaminase
MNKTTSSSTMPNRTATKPLPFHVPAVQEEEIEAVVEALRSGWISTGPKTKCFEEAFAKYIGARHAVAVSSGTAALHLSLEAIGLQQDDEVLVPAMTFTATAEVAAYFKAKPVLVDIEPVHFNISLGDAERKYTRKTRAILPVHFAGHPCPMVSVAEFAAAKGLTVIEDAAHALPASYLGHTIGTLSPLTAFSFHAVKTLTTGEGGMVTTDDDRLAERIRIMRLHGMDREAWKRYSAEGTWRYEISEAGYKYNLTDPQAAMGLVQLSKCEQMWRRRAAIAEQYRLSLESSDSFCTPKTDEDVQHAWHLYVILINPAVLRINRDQIIEELRRRRIGTGVHFIPLHLQPYYQRTWGYRLGDFPVAEDYFERCISLPIYPTMTVEDAERVIMELQDVSAEFRR